MPKITFVDKNDHIIGYGTKAEAISQGIIHRIARIFVLNSQGKLLIQKRSSNVASPNKWDQSAAGHVDEGEDYHTAAIRELEEEVGISGTSLQEITKFYSEESDDVVTKKRFNVLYSTAYDDDVTINPEEVSEFRWIKLKVLEKWMHQKPEDFTQGFLQSYRHFTKNAVL